MSIIVDGKGSGTRAAVTASNSLMVTGITEDAYVSAAGKGEAYNITTALLTYSGTAPFAQNCLYIKNNETRDLEMVGWFIGELNNRTGGSPTTPILFEMYGNPTGTAVGTDLAIVNRRIGAPRQFNIEAKAQPTGVTGSGSSLLFQLHYGSRGFGSVNFTVPAGQSILVVADFASDSQALYTGFTGYVRGE